MSLKAGRKPLAARKTGTLREDEVFGNLLKLDPELKKELEDLGYEWRFVDAKKLYEMGGYHAKGWRVYKRKSGSGTMDFKFGNDPDGVVRRGTCILAVKTKAEAQLHRDVLRQKAEVHTAVIKRHAEGLRQTARERDVDVHVDDTYDEDVDTK